MSESPVRLIPLMCIKCSQPILAQPDEMAWVCSTCSQGQILGADGTLGKLDVFFSAGIKSGEKGWPFWVSAGQVVITERQTYQGNNAREAADFWGTERLFYIPAFNVPLEKLIATGMTLLKNPVTIQQAGSPTPFWPVVTGMKDVKPLSEFIVLAIEADRKDALKRVNFSLQLKTPQLWVLP